MFKVSEFTKEVYKPKDVMKLLGVTHRTLYNYDEQGKLKFQQSEFGRRIMFREDLLHYLDEKGLLLDDTLDQVKQYLKETKEIKKEELLAIIEEREELLWE